ncbi:hypothetical protein [Nostoc sp.]|uniref:hypothetical protein n=1 Tax=Nostoc sp. TaxID=1180 RepID=UPI002FF4BD57
MSRLSRSQSPTGNAILGAAASLAGGRATFELHFQPPAGNEVLKEFQLKLTPMPCTLLPCRLNVQTIITTAYSSYLS